MDTQGTSGFYKTVRLAACLLLILAGAIPGLAQNDQGTPEETASGDRTIWSLTIQGVIGPANADFFTRNLEAAAEANVELVLLRLDTPGGLDKSMRTMIQAILSSPVPVATYVEPSGARAASAGTYILYASHIAAMAPATNLGAATPVQIGSPGLPQMPDESGSQDGGEGKGDDEADGGQPQGAEQPKTAMEKKIVNDAVAYIRGLAELRNRNADWAETAVRQGASLSAEQALENNVIDILAESVADLKQQMDGQEVKVGEATLTLNTKDANVVHHEPDWRSELLEVITNPNVAYILMLVGIYGLIFEFSNPGLGGPGVIGAICLLLALYAFQVLPVSYVGVALVLLGIALMGAEAFSPTFGIAGASGLATFIIGSVLLMDSNLPAYQIALPVILGVAVASAALLIVVLGMVFRTRRQPVVSGTPALINEQAAVESVHEGTPLVRIQGELWQAHCSEPLAPGDRVRVESVDRLTLNVEKLSGA